jgi:filamentous hemagglutinin family protein
MKSYQLKFLLASYGTLYGLAIASPAVSQIVPDSTLPVNSQVTQQGDTSLIQGGTQVGTNLFHSFQEFSIPTGGTAFFNNTGEIENILTRVTGGSISNINGVIKANGNANMFLLNPNGIVFNSNARLEIGGSFLGSTANSIIFADRSSFSTINPQTTLLLTISVPVGLQFGQNPAPIVVQNNGYNLSTAVPIFSPIMKRNSSTGLRVSPGNSLALVGGDLNLQGGILTAEQGRIELGSIRQGQVDFNTDFAFNYSNIREFGNIRCRSRGCDRSCYCIW